LEEQKIKIKVGFTSGDMNGVGAEILLGLLSDSKLLSLITPIIYAPLKNLKYISSHMGLDLSFKKINSPKESEENKINVIDNFKSFAEISFGDLDKEMGETAYQSIKISVQDLNDKKIDVLVTAPINKEAIHSESFKFMGHTDYIDSQIDGNAVMMMVSDELKVALLTEHIPISKVTETITKDLVRVKIKNLHKTLIRDFQIEKPKIAILSIDPHAGDGGVIAKNDQEVTAPVIKEMNDNGFLVYGPFSSDSFFGSLEYKKYDITVASFHDQGLIPFKTLSFGKGVNYSSGLERIRTSPDHGTAYGIAGKGEASKDSFLTSIFLALDIYKMRKTHDEYSKNKL
jgi:4-hydroxythreonine-4-phosphate dehydrogenase